MSQFTQDMMRLREIINYVSGEDTRVEARSILFRIETLTNFMREYIRANEKGPRSLEPAVGTTVHDAGQPPASHV